MSSVRFAIWLCHVHFVTTFGNSPSLLTFSKKTLRNVNRKIIFSYESHFWLNGFVNKQNCRQWGESNSRVVQETQLHPQKLSVWCKLRYGGNIGPYSFWNEAGKAVTINIECYNTVLTHSFFAEFDEIDAEDLYFAQDSAPPHVLRLNMDTLPAKFGDPLISSKSASNAQGARR